MEFCIELEKLSSSTRKSIALDTNIPELITALKGDSDEEVRVCLSVNPNVKEPTLSEMANDNYEPVRINVALHPNASDDTKSKIYCDDNVAVRVIFAENTSDKYWLERCAKDYDPRVRLITIDNPNMDVELAFWIVQHDSFPFFFRQSANCFKQQLRRDFLSCLLIARLGFFVLKILIKRIKLPFLMQGKVGKRHFLCSATPDFLMGVAGFVVQHPFTETLKDTLLLKFHAIRFHVLTSCYYIFAP